MALVLSGSIDISGSMTATTIVVSAPGAPGMVSSSNQLVELNTATGSQDLVNLGISTFTGSLRDEVNGIEAYTSSLKAQPIVSSSAQISSALTSISVTQHSDVTSAGSGEIITSTERTRLENAELAYSVSVISGNTNAVKDTLYVLTATLTLTLPGSPTVGDRIGVSNQSGTTTPIIARNGNLITGLAEDLTLDVDNLGIQLIYTGATKGWIIL